MNILMKKFQNKELSGLAEKSNLREDIDYGCQFITAYDDDGKLIGAVGFNLETMKYPRLEHVIISTEYQGSRLVVRLLKKMEDYIFGYLNEGCYVSYILDTDNRMKAYAEHWGMKSFQNDGKGTFYFKTPKKEQ